MAARKFRFGVVVSQGQIAGAVERLSPESPGPRFLHIAGSRPLWATTGATPRRRGGRRGHLNVARWDLCPR